MRFFPPDGSPETDKSYSTTREAVYCVRVIKQPNRYAMIAVP